MTNIYGQDVLLDENLQPVTAPSGMPVLTTGPQTAVQEIRILLAHPIGGLFYDPDFGTLLHQVIREEYSPLVVNEIESELTKRVNSSGYVDIRRTRVTFQFVDNESFKVEISLYLVEEERPYFLVMQEGADVNFIIKDLNEYV